MRAKIKISFFIILIVLVSAPMIVLNNNASYINKYVLKYNEGSFSSKCHVQVALENGQTLQINGTDVIINGKIVNRQPLYEDGWTDAEIDSYIAQYSSANTSATVEEDKATVDQSTSSANTTTENTITNNSETKTETKAPTYTEEEIAAAWEETNRTESTCTENGSIEYTNSLTDEIKTEELELAEHDYQETEKTEATCTEDGSIIYTCSVCGDSYSDTIPATGHTEGNWVITREARLFSEGLKQEVCPVDNEVLDEKVIPQTCPIPLAGVIGIIVAIAIVAGVSTGVVINKKKKAI